MHEKTTIKLDLPKTLYELIEEIGKENNKDVQTIITEALYLYTLGKYNVKTKE